MRSAAVCISGCGWGRSALAPGGTSKSLFISESLPAVRTKGPPAARPPGTRPRDTERELLGGAGGWAAH